MPVRTRLDRELVRRGLLPSREQALAAIAAGRVSVSGQQAIKPARGVAANEPIEILGDDPGYASRGAHKLAGALEAFAATRPPLQVAGRRCLDAGASTGGFTDVLLREGVQSVVAVDVGYGQLIWRLQNDDRVRVIDRTNVRYLTPELIGGQVELVVADLSFISLRIVLPALTSCVVAEGDLVVLVKPQFEVGRELVGRGGRRSRARVASRRDPRCGGRRERSGPSAYAVSSRVRFRVQQAISNTCSGWQGMRSR